MSVRFDRNATRGACVRQPMRRSLYAGTIALAATIGMTGPAMAGPPSENFKFEYDGAYGDNGLSQPYGGPTTAQSFGAGVAINPSDPSQKVYTLVEVNPNIGVGGPRGAFPASSRTIPPSSTPAIYGPPGAVLHRAPHHGFNKVVVNEVAGRHDALHLSAKLGVMLNVPPEDIADADVLEIQIGREQFRLGSLAAALDPHDHVLPRALPLSPTHARGFPSRESST